VTVLRRLDRGLVGIERWLLVVFLGTMLILAFLQVVLRNVFSTGLLWADPLVRHAVLWVGFLGAAIATHEERHISIDALTRFLPRRWKAAAAIASQLFVVVVCVALVNASWDFLMEESHTSGVFIAGIPSYVPLLIIPGGYLLIAFHAVIRVVTLGPSLAARHPVPEQ
jgi:TRAP-type C4-dicarboxylate transport system permease small subunit